MFLGIMRPGLPHRAQVYSSFVLTRVRVDEQEDQEGTVDHEVYGEQDASVTSECGLKRE